MTHRLTTNYAKNDCNRTLIVKVIVENVVTCFLGTQCISVIIICAKSSFAYLFSSAYHVLSLIRQRLRFDL